MVILKSVLAGIVSTVLFIVLASVSMITILLVKSSGAKEPIGWDPVSLTRQSVLVWVLLASSFLVGFVWEYRRALR